jgi:hypothetical protein
MAATPDEDPSSCATLLTDLQRRPQLARRRITRPRSPAASGRRHPVLQQLAAKHVQSRPVSIPSTGKVLCCRHSQRESSRHGPAGATNCVVGATYTRACQSSQNYSQLQLPAVYSAIVRLQQQLKKHASTVRLLISEVGIACLKAPNLRNYPKLRRGFWGRVSGLKSPGYNKHLYSRGTN